MGQDDHVGGEGGGHPGDHRLLDGSEHPEPGRLPVSAPHHQLGHQIVVVLADRVTSSVTGVEPDAGSTGGDELGDRARRRGERTTGRVLGVDAHLDGVSIAGHIVLAEAQWLTRCHPKLPLHQVEPGDQFGDRVFHLEPGVHLQEEEFSVLIEEFDGPGIDVAAGLGHSDGGSTHGLADLVGEVRGGALFHQLLVAALARAVSLAQP